MLRGFTVRYGEGRHGMTMSILGYILFTWSSPASSPSRQYKFQARSGVKRWLRLGTPSAPLRDEKAKRNTEVLQVAPQNRAFVTASCSLMLVARTQDGAIWARSRTEECTIESRNHNASWG